MTNTHPPRVALWLLEHFGPDNEPLVGDLVEQFEISRSRWWFWRQAVVAVAMARFDGPREIRPLRLLDREPGSVPVAPLHRRTINLTASPLHGTGGLGLVALGVLMTVTVPQIWWVLLAIVLDGILLGLAWAFFTRPKTNCGATAILFGGDPEPRQPGHDPQANA